MRAPGMQTAFPACVVFQRTYWGPFFWDQNETDFENCTPFLTGADLKRLSPRHYPWARGQLD
jgi:hypothetical protein